MSKATFGTILLETKYISHNFALPQMTGHLWAEAFNLACDSLNIMTTTTTATPEKRSYDIYDVSLRQQLSSQVASFR